MILVFCCSCSNRQKNAPIEVVPQDTVIVADTRRIEDTVTIEDDESKYIYISTIPDYGEPENEAELQSWKDKVMKKGDEYSYLNLAEYYHGKPDKYDKMIKFSEIMIDKKRDHDTYKFEYYHYVSNSNVKKKAILMKKAIRYLNQVLAANNDEFHNELSRRYLKKEYEKGIYVKRDTVIVSYLKNGGNNLDSIVTARTNR